MKVRTNTADNLMHKFGLKDVPLLRESFIDTETVLHYLRENVTTIREPKPHMIGRGEATIKMIPNDKCQIRDYQFDILNKIFQENTIYPSLVIMPCGSGKTFTGACLIAMVQKRSLVITNFKVVANQWKREILRFFNIDELQVQSIGEDSFAYDINNPPMITILTYDTLSSIISVQSQSLLRKILMTNFTTIILDEAHKAVATSYFNIIVKLTGTFVALTATPVREDLEMRLLKQLVNDEHIVCRDELIQAGFVSPVFCSTIIVPTDPTLYDKKLKQDKLLSAAVINPNKVAYLMRLLNDMIKLKHKIIVFCDDIWSLNFTFNKIKHAHSIIGPVSMITPLKQREICIEKFIKESAGSIIMISRTGDEGIDVPCASAIIQICTSWGSRRQHAQRIGRIQRISSDSSLRCEAISIVSDNTIEMKFAQKRDAYLQSLKYPVSISYSNITSNEDCSTLVKLLNKKNKKKHAQQKAQQKAKQKMHNDKKKSISTFKKRLNEKYTKTHYQNR